MHRGPHFYAALLVYEYLITLGEESRLIWTNLRAGYAALFLVNRVIMLCMSIAMVLSVSNWHSIVVRPPHPLHSYNTVLTWAEVRPERPQAGHTTAECPWSCQEVTNLWIFVSIAISTLWTGAYAFHAARSGVLMWSDEGVSALRVYAISRRSVVIAACTAAVALVSVVINVVSYAFSWGLQTRRC